MSAQSLGAPVMQETTATLQARKFLGGELLKFTQADALWKELTAADEFSLARRVLKRIRERPESLTNEIPDDDETRDHLCRQEAMLTSKDPALNAATRHDEALRILGRCFRLGSKELDGDGETLGIAGGICKRRWTDLGQLNDLVRAGEFYERGSRGPLGNDAYAHINS